MSGKRFTPEQIRALIPTRRSVDPLAFRLSARREAAGTRSRLPQAGIIVEIREIESVFKRFYKGRVVEVKRRGNAKRPWLPQVDGYGVSPGWFTTSTFSSPKLALDCATRFVDDQIGRISQLRQTSPKEAVADAQRQLTSAEKSLACARTPEAIEYSTTLIRRLRTDTGPHKF